MKRLIIIAIILVSSLCYAKKPTPIIVYDPNTVIESPTDPNNITITIAVEITKDQYAAMQYLNMTLIDVVRQSKLSRTLDRLISKAKALMVEVWTVTELKAIKDK